jgi:hypothetical protein
MGNACVSRENIESSKISVKDNLRRASTFSKLKYDEASMKMKE